MSIESEQPWIRRPLEAGRMLLTQAGGVFAGTEAQPAEAQPATAITDWVAIATENARLYQASERRRRELEQALRGLRSDQLRSSLAAADAERGRWARELHDETLQGLGGLRVLLSAALRRKDPQHTERSLREAVGHIEREIENLRTVITELRPAALDELGLQAAIEALVDRHREHSGFGIDSRLELAHPQPGAPHLDAELQTTVYRLLQEALTNVAKHAQARHVRVAVEQRGDELLIEVRDDGAGFAIDAQTAGFGLAGMRERASLAGGRLQIASDERGTLVRAHLPVPLPLSNSVAAPRVAHIQA